METGSSDIGGAGGGYEGERDKDKLDDLMRLIDNTNLYSIKGGFFSFSWYFFRSIYIY